MASVCDFGTSFIALVSEKVERVVGCTASHRSMITPSDPQA